MDLLKPLLAKAAISCALLAATPAHAFLNELIGAGVEVGGKLLGAGFDKVKDSMKDHEAEARLKKEAHDKQLNAFNEAVARIEERTDLSPLQKERAVRQVQQQFDFANRIAALDSRAQAHRRAQRDRLFTAEGMLDTVGNAAVGAASTRIALAKADAMVAAGVPQAQTRDVFSQIDASAVNDAREKTQRVLAMAAVSTVEPAAAQQPADPVSEDAFAARPPLVVSAEPQDLTGAETETAASNVASLPMTAFTPDLNRKVALTFVGAPKTQDALRARLVAMGHEVVEDESVADVIYRIEGEYVVPEGKQFSGTRQSFGEILDAKSIAWQPERKMSGAIGAGVTKLMLALGKAQGAQLPKELEVGNLDSLKQDVLLVISREPKFGKTTRASVSRVASSPDVQAVPMVLATYAELLEKLGFNP